MFEQFTDQGRRVVVLAQEEAWLLHHNYIGTEHLLLGLIHEGDNPAAAMLGGSGVTLDVARAAVEDVVGRGEHGPETSHIPFASGAKTVLEVAWRQASRSGYVAVAGPQAALKAGRGVRPWFVRVQRAGNEIGPGHILLGLIEEGGVAIEVLDRLHVDLAELRLAVLAAMAAARRADRRGRRLPVSRIFPAEPIVRCPGCDFNVSLVGQLGELHIRIARGEVDPSFRMYVRAGDTAEFLAHECGTETTAT